MNSGSYLPTIIAGIFIFLASLISAWIINDWTVWTVFGIGISITILLLIIHEKYQSKTPLGYIPNIWTGLGVLFTFWVIWDSLSSGNAFSDLSEATDKGKDLQNLVKELAKAFSSSIVGVITSLASAVAIKILLSIKEHQQEKINKQAYTSPEITLWDLKENNKKQLSELYELFSQSNLPRKFYREMLLHKQETQEVKRLLSHIPADFKEQLESLLSNLNKKLEQEIKNMGQTALDQAKDNIADINGELKKVMATLIEDSSKLLGANLEELQTTTKVSKEAIEGMSAHYTNNANAIQAKFQELTEVFSDFDKTIQTAVATTLKEGVDNLEKTFDRIKDWQLSAKIELETISNSFKEAVKEYTAFKDANKGIIEELQEQTEQLKILKEEVAAIPEYDSKIEEMQNRISEIGTTIEELGKIKELLTLKQN